MFQQKAQSPLLTYASTRSEVYASRKRKDNTKRTWTSRERKENTRRDLEIIRIIQKDNVLGSPALCHAVALARVHVPQSVCPGCSANVVPEAQIVHLRLWKESATEKDEGKSIENGVIGTRETTATPQTRQRQVLSPVFMPHIKVLIE